MQSCMIYDDESDREMKKKKIHDIRKKEKAPHTKHIQNEKNRESVPIYYIPVLPLV